MEKTKKNMDKINLIREKSLLRLGFRYSDSHGEMYYGGDFPYHMTYTLYSGTVTLMGCGKRGGDIEMSVMINHLEDLKTFIKIIKRKN